MPLRINGLTSGSVTLQAPNTGSDVTLTLPTTGFGKILQIVRATDSTNRSTTSATDVDASISVTITPQVNTSAVLLLWSVQIQTPATVNQATWLTLTDSSNNAISGANSGRIQTPANDIIRTPVVLIGYATPATTNATTYKGRFRSSNAGSTSLLINSEMTGQLIAIEVSA